MNLLAAELVSDVIHNAPKGNKDLVKDYIVNKYWENVKSRTLLMFRFAKNI